MTVSAETVNILFTLISTDKHLVFLFTHLRSDKYFAFFVYSDMLGHTLTIFYLLI